MLTICDKDTCLFLKEPLEFKAFCIIKENSSATSSYDFFPFQQEFYDGLHFLSSLSGGFMYQKLKNTVFYAHRWNLKVSKYNRAQWDLLIRQKIVKPL